jgi:Icc-related predicted phosphoesterase
VKVLIFSDIHGDLRALARIVAQPAGLYICAGDLATFQKGLEKCGQALEPLGDKLWVLPGNHETHDDIGEFCRKYGFVDFHRRVLQTGSTPWAGLGYSNITPFHTPGEYTEEEISEELAAFNGMAGLHLVIHVPPYDTRLDEFAPGKHAGSPALRAWVQREQPAYLFCGHIHETAGLSDQIGTTKCINVGKEGYLLEI